MLTLLGCGQGQASITVIALINAFKARVQADSGIYEAEACQIITLNKLTI
jgi:hypothetical protein